MDFIDFLRHFPWNWLFVTLPTWIADRLQSWWSTLLFWLGFAGLLLGAYLHFAGLPPRTVTLSCSLALLLITVALLAGPRPRA